MAQKDLAAAEAAYMKKLELALALYERTQLPVGAVTAAYSYEGLATLLTQTRSDEALAFARKGTELLLKLQAAGALSATDETLLASLKARVPD